MLIKEARFMEKLEVQPTILVMHASTFAVPISKSEIQKQTVLPIRIGPVPETTPMRKRDI